MGFLRGCWKCCMLLLAGWCEGFCGVQVNEALSVMLPLCLFCLLCRRSVHTVLDLISCRWLLGRSRFNRIWLAFFRHCCVLRLKDKIQVGSIPVCVSSAGRITPCRTIVARLPTSAVRVLAGRHPVHLVGSLSESLVQQRCAYL